jgi:hypothetical protein
LVAGAHLGPAILKVAFEHIVKKLAALVASRSQTSAGANMKV